MIVSPPSDIPLQISLSLTWLFILSLAPPSFHLSLLYTRYTATGLTHGDAYTFRIAAINGVGTSASADQASTGGVIPYTNTNAPTAVSAAPGDKQLIVSWTAPSSNGGSAITGYKVEKKEGSGSYAIAVANTGSDAVTYTATGLTNGNSYTFKVSAINSAAGTSAASTESQTSVPSAASILVNSGTASLSKNINTQTTISLAAQGTTPSADVTVTVTVAQGSTGCSIVGGASSTTVTLISGGILPQTFQLESGTVIGTCTLTFSTSSSDNNYNVLTPAPTALIITINSVAVAPTSVTVVPSGASGTLKVSWTAPIDTGNQAVTGYTLEKSTDSGSNWLSVSGGVVSTTETTLTGLDNDVPVSLRVAVSVFFVFFYTFSFSH
jgi:titin